MVAVPRTENAEMGQFMAENVVKHEYLPCVCCVEVEGEAHFYS